MQPIQRWHPRGERGPFLRKGLAGGPDWVLSWGRGREGPKVSLAACGVSVLRGLPVPMRFAAHASRDYDVRSTRTHISYNNTVHTPPPPSRPSLSRGCLGGRAGLIKLDTLSHSKDAVIGRMTGCCNMAIFSFLLVRMA